MKKYIAQAKGAIFDGFETIEADVEASVSASSAEEALRIAKELPTGQFHSGLATDEVCHVDRDSLQVFED